MARAFAIFRIFVYIVIYRTKLGYCVDESKQLEFCDPNVEDCDFTNEIEVAFDDAHTYLLNQQTVMDSFAYIMLFWVNTHYKCIGEEDFFYGIEFEEEINTANDGRSKPAGRRGRGKGRCRGKQCPRTPDFGYPKMRTRTASTSSSESFSYIDPCEVSLLTALRRSNPIFFADVERVDVSFARIVEYESATANTTAPIVNITLQNVTAVNETDNVFFDSSAVALSGGGNVIVLGKLTLGLQVFERDGTTDWELAHETTWEPFSTIVVSMTPSGESFIATGYVQALVFSWGGTSWSRRGQSLKGFCRWQLISWSFARLSVAISNDGDTVAVGSWMNTKVWVYTYNESSQRWKVCHVLRNSFFELPLLSSWFGNQLSMASNDEGSAKTLIVAATRETTSNGIGSGSVSVFDLTTGERTQKILGEGAISRFGSSVSIANDGSRFAVVSAMFDSDGWVDIYEHNAVDSQYEALENRIFVFYPTVFMSSDGYKVIVGSPYNSEYGYRTGKAFLYDIEGEEFELTRTFNGKGEDNRFGSHGAMSEDGNTIAIGTGLNGEYVNIYYDQ